MQAVTLRTEFMENPLGIDIMSPYLSWICQGGITQTAYEIAASSDGTVIWNSGIVKTNRMNAIFEAPLKSRQRVSWRVRLWDESNQVGGFSEPAVFEMGLLDLSEFTAKWINPELVCNPMEHKPASYLKTSFTTVKGKPARLYVTCHGLYEVLINGNRVGDFVLAPGTNTYHQKLAYQTYDVTGLIREGNNDVKVILGDGWYRSCSGVDGDRNLHGEDVALLFQLEVDGIPVCVSDESWQATQQGPLRENDMQQGEVYDAGREELTDWHEVKVEEVSLHNLCCSNSVPIVEHERFAGKRIVTPNGETVIDYGQNLAGYIEFTVKAHAGEVITLTHGEELDEQGNFTAENFQDRKRHKEGGVEQRVVYTCKEGVNHYKSRFTIWGFRYARVRTDIDLSEAEFTAIAVYSQMAQTGWFECADENVNKLLQNSIWSQKSNFCDVPTDCPTRERAAWTGDMGIYAETGISLMDCYPVIRKWLAECRLNQFDDGRVAFIAPKNNRPSELSDRLACSCAWGDASILVPYTLYKRFGDIRILEDNYEMMRRWYAFFEKRAEQTGADGLDPENPYEKYTVNTGFDFGEWCEPGVSMQEGMMTSGRSVGTAYLALSGKYMSEIADFLGRAEEAAHYRLVSEMAGKAFRYKFTEGGRIRSDRQCEYVRALAFNLLEEQDCGQAAKDLNNLVIQNDYHLNTGFLSTPFLCEVLTEYGYTDTAYRLLLQDTRPSWLYAVKKGATTIWECWDGINEQGELNASLNHYSYGAVCGWLFSGVCGIKLSNGKVTIAPHPHPALGHARATYRSPVGEIVSGWKYENDEVHYEFVIPANVTAQVILADGRQELLTAGMYQR